MIASDPDTVIIILFTAMLSQLVYRPWQVRWQHHQQAVLTLYIMISR